MNATPTTKKVKLKRVESLRKGDRIQPGMGLFTRDGGRITSRAAMSDTWGMTIWTVVDAPWMNALPELCVPLGSQPDEPASDIIHTPLDAYVVLIP